jgi:hypothetical protein
MSAFRVSSLDVNVCHFFSEWRDAMTPLLRTHFHIRRHFVRPLLLSVSRGSTSTVIQLASASNVLGQHNKIGGITFRALPPSNPTLQRQLMETAYSVSAKNRMDNF